MLGITIAVALLELTDGKFSELTRSQAWLVCRQALMPECHLLIRLAKVVDPNRGARVIFRQLSFARKKMMARHFRSDFCAAQ